MRPPRAGACFATLFALGILAMGGRSSARASTAPALSEPTSAQLSFLLAAASEKQRVPKEERRHKPDTTGSRSGPSASGEDEGSTNCFFDCLGSFFSSMFSSPTPPPPPGPEAALAAGTISWTAGDRGRLRAPTAVDSVWLWDGPGGADQDRVQVGRLPDGVAMMVVEAHALQTGLWVRVKPANQSEPIGWVPASSLMAEPLPTGPEGPPKRPPTWGVMLALGGCGIGPADLNVEYDEGGLRLEAQYLRYLPKHWQSGAGLGWRDYHPGHPRVSYVTGGTTYDEPSDSKLQILDVGLRAGTRHGSRSGFRAWWLLGPALYYVHEQADIRVIDSNTGFQVNEHKEELKRWAAGGDLRLMLGWRLKSQAEVGLLLGGYIMAWEGQHRFSLTTDFIEDEIHGFDVALSVSFPAP